MRVEADGFPQVLDRLVHFAFPAQRQAEVVVGTDVIRAHVEGFLELADRFVELAVLDQGQAEEVVAVAETRVEAEGFPQVLDRLAHFASLAQDRAEVDECLGVIRFEAEGFLELPGRLLELAFLAEGGAEVVVGAVIALRDRDRMPEQGFTVLPITKLLPRHGQAEDHRHATRRRQRQHQISPASDQFSCAPDQQDQHPE
jgi:hypothetical protein